MPTGFELGFQQVGEDQRQKQLIAEQQKIARQAKLSAIIGDSLNALPLPKDENGNPDINNPVYNDILQRRHSLIGSLMDEYTPVQHANIVQRIGGLITGNKQHAMPHHNQPLPVMGTGPAALAAQAGGEQAAQAQQDLQASDPNQIPLQPVQNVPVASHPMAALPDGHPANKILQGIKSLGETLKSHGQAFVHPAIKQPDQSELIKNIAEGYQDPKQLQHERDMELYGLRGENALEVARTRGVNIRPVHLGNVTPQTAIKNMDNLGYVYMQEDGTPYTKAELSEMPEGTQISEFRQGGSTFAKAFDQKASKWSIGGIDYAAMPLGEQGQHTLKPLGQTTSTLPASSTATETSPGGAQVVKGTTERERTPTGVFQAPSIPAPAGAAASEEPAATVIEPPKPALKVRPAASIAAPVPLTPKDKTVKVGTSSIGDVAPNIQNMTQANAAKAMKSQPAVTALLGLYGDPQLPQVKSMMDFSKLADDPHAQKVLGEAFKLLNQQMGTISDPGVISTLGTAMGWANFRANAEAQAQQNVGTQMTDDEKEYFNAAIAAMADIIGARAATGQSPARFSVQFMENEVPQIGTSSVTNQKSYFQKLLTIARQVKVGLNAMPDNSRALKHLLNSENKIIQQSNALSPKLNPKSANAPSGPTGRPAGVPADYVLRDGPKGRGYYAPNAK